MRSKFSAILAILLLVVGLVPVIAQEPTREIDGGNLLLQIGQERIVNTAVTTISVANPEVARATVMSGGNALLITAVGPGSTEIRVVSADDPGAVKRYTVIVKRDLEETRKSIDSLLAFMVGVQIEKAGENLVLKGDVLEPQDRERLNKVIEMYPEVIDFTVARYAQVEEDRLRELIMNDLEEEGLTTIRVEIKNVRGTFKAMLRGVAFTDRAKNRAEEIAKLYYENVINLVQLEKPVIEVDVVVAQLDLNKVKQLGTNDVFAAATSFTITGYLNSNFGRDSFFENDADNRGQDPGAQRPDEPGISVAPTFSLAPGGVSSFIRAVKQTDAAIFYSEQHQAVLSGEKATFNDGGTLIFKTTTANTSEVTTIEFGLIVDVTPEQKEDGTIVNTIKVENTNPVALSSSTSGADVALNTFKTESVVECRSEETIVLSGADSNNLTHSDTGTPFLRRVPLVNLLFRARDKQGGESRSLIFITPTSSTIFREERASFSTSARRKSNFMRNESIYWERDLDWGYYNEFYERPGNTVPYVNTYTKTLFYDDQTQSLSTVGGASFDAPAPVSEEPMGEPYAEPAAEPAPVEPAL